MVVVVDVVVCEMVALGVGVTVGFGEVVGADVVVDIVDVAGVVVSTCVGLDTGGTVVVGVVALSEVDAVPDVVATAGDEGVVATALELSSLRCLLRSFDSETVRVFSVAGETIGCGVLFVLLFLTWISVTLSVSDLRLTIGVSTVTSNASDAFDRVTCLVVFRVPS